MARILVIDDEERVRYTISKALTALGCEIIEASNGRQGLEAVEIAPVDVVITDIIMPEMEGINTILELRKRWPDIKIIAISGGGRSRSVDFLKAAQQFGAEVALQKPFAMDQLAKAVKKCLASGEDNVH